MKGAGGCENDDAPLLNVHKHAPRCDCACASRLYARERARAAWLRTGGGQKRFRFRLRPDLSLIHISEPTRLALI
eukprot:15455065-Alexandrium_andersonii.AAC.1